MSNSVKKMPVTTEDKSTRHPLATDLWRPLEKLRQQVDHLFDDFNRGSGLSPFGRGLFDVEPFWRRELMGHGMPAVDICEKDKSYEITAELPGMDQKNIEIKLSNGSLIIKGEKKEDKEENRKGYHLSERHYGSFERVFNLPKGVDAEKIDASFSKGVLSISLPKKPEAMKADTVVPIKGE
ncbi:Hsp20/alpha crystallin family protein [Pseudomonas sp. Os17]|uniref:Hsp20/alpha crystallin family protein n=1 Tax=Pseudomonas protegens TaxID=380021 RepID=A0A2T6GGI2_9PSED|nr:MULTISPECIES: Hsp20/alpha crystallin family protein [Pseudomonas]PUA43257.1 Hsp20/alpha crystallin family protein [Pseudomonas protegens]RXU67946.1 Hsp20/alpha crystallin family protein [Pseudomonas protegens]ULT73244.1 Hsp20/alpha crystallin family protein [Pseudomonas sp. BC42]BAQ75403.1 Hsp20/alpha crystallin family protein [Pseudomonas sp. Os17]